MTDFNPYHKWLGIPLDEQPASYYRLLGIAEFESDLDVIEGAAERQIIYLRTFQTGPNFELAERLLNEISEARVWLLDEQAKVKYDQLLREGNRPTLPPVSVNTDVLTDESKELLPPLPGNLSEATASQPGQAPSQSKDAIPSLPFSPQSQPFAVWKPAAAASSTRGRGTKPIWQQWQVMVPIVVVIAIVLVILLTSGPSGNESKPADGQGKATNPSDNSPATRKPPTKPLPVTEETILSQARGFARSLARTKKFPNTQIAEACAIAELLISPYCQQLAKKEKQERDDFYKFVSGHAIQLLEKEHGWTDHGLRYREQRLQGKNPPRSREDFDQLSKDAETDYRSKYAESFNQQARDLLDSEQK